MVNDCNKDVPVILSSAFGIREIAQMSVMELVRPRSTAHHPSRTDLYQPNHGGSKWSFSYVKELLLSAPRAPTTISPPNTGTTASTELTAATELTASTELTAAIELAAATELTAIFSSSQIPSTTSVTPASSEAVSIATADALALENGLKRTEGPGTEIPTESQVRVAALPHGNAAGSASPTDAAVPTDSAGRRVYEAATVLKLSKSLYISPNMKADSKSQEVWTRQIKDRLNAELWHALRTERCLQEFVMIGPRPDCLRASVLITCCGESAAKRVRKVVKGLKWLRDFDVPCAVVVDKIHLYSKNWQDQTGGA